MIKTNSTINFVNSVSDKHSSGGQMHWVPNTDVWIAETGLVIKVELAGMRREDLELTVEGNRLRISGQRIDDCRVGKCSFIVMEINYGPFESIIDIPAGYDVTKAKALYQNGFLRIDIPPVATTSPAKIPIRNGE
ncbi:MAG: Hsp20/alpha crystallin family protein [Verrucomicrobiia bacterium]